MLAAQYLILGGIAIVVAIGGMRWAFRRRWWPIFALFTLLLVPALPAATLGAYLVACRFREATPTSFDLAPGVTYSREVVRAPRPVVLHIAIVDLQASGIAVRITPPRHAPTGFTHRASRTTAPLVDPDSVLAINASFFEPFWLNAPWDYYPHEGDGVRVVGRVASHGVVIGTAWRGAVLNLTPDQRAVFNDGEALHEAVEGSQVLLRNGSVVANLEDTTPYPRTAAGADASGRRLFLLVADGKQPRYSEGLTEREVAEHLLRLGAHDAVMLDGGGSSVMASRHGGRVQLLSSPCHASIPGFERPVANHLVVYASPGRTD